jgi:hypothetical protein
LRLARDDRHAEARNQEAEAAKEKIKMDYAKGDAPVHPVATVLDPRFKLEYHCAHNWEPEWVDLAKDSVERALSMYLMLAAQNAPTNDRGEPKGTPAECMMGLSGRASIHQLSCTTI